MWRLTLLGRGAFGKVYLVKHVQSQSLYAMKVLKKASLVLHANQIKTERQILEQIRHPFIVQLYYAFQTPNELRMILEYAVGGELFRYLDQHGRFTESMAVFYAAELVLALSHLHSLGIVYRDLKPENVLLDCSGHVLLTDFGLSKVSVEEDKANTICGTVEYMAPEVLAGLRYGFTVDWWGLGIFIYDMLVGVPPFRGRTRQDTINAIMSKNVPMVYYFSAATKDLLSKLLRKNPHLRLGYKTKDQATLRNHPFFKDIDWVALADRGVDPPIHPIVNFDPMFTSEPIEASSSDPTPGLLQDHFENFSFVDGSVRL
ncbi:kinase-like domain-containing protein [Dichotomocladium elegans]|nr:kinase-like domain-containing protein [Dichotomocladium elegans]